MRAIFLGRMAIAGALLTGCTINITNPLITGTGIVNTQASPTPKPKATGPDEPPIKPSATPKVKPSPGTPCSDALQTITVTGRVFDTTGQPVANARVRLMSTSAVTPYDSTLDAPGGQFKVNVFGGGTSYVLTVTADGFQAQKRKIELPEAAKFSCGDPAPITKVFNFGGPATEADPDAPSYALSAAPPAGTISADNLSGLWTFSESAEPPAGPVVGCVANDTMTLKQDGGKISGTVSFCNGPCRPGGERFDGTAELGKVAMKGSYDPGDPNAGVGVVSYELKFDPATQHLVGTRNGQPFWAAPFVAKTDCGPVAQ